MNKVHFCIVVYLIYYIIFLEAGIHKWKWKVLIGSGSYGKVRKLLRQFVVSGYVQACNQHDILCYLSRYLKLRRKVTQSDMLQSAYVWINMMILISRER